MTRIVATSGTKYNRSEARGDGHVLTGDAVEKPAGIETRPARAVRVLSVSPLDGDHTGLHDIFQNAESSLDIHCKWTLCPIRTLASAADALQQEEVPIIIIEGDLRPGSWREMLEHISLLPD